MTEKRQQTKTVYLSFDIEEFDMPLEYNGTIELAEQISVSVEGCKRVLNILDEAKVKATFFSTVVFAKHATGIIDRIVKEGHELASHGVYHSRFETAHLLESRLELEKISNQKVNGFRMARMMAVEANDIENAGYSYNSSLNPVYLPGRYNNYFKPRTSFYTGSLLEIPASATPYVRIPLFWLAFHNFPINVYRGLCQLTMQTDRYLNLYFHPWEFCDLSKPAFKLPPFTRKRTGEEMVQTFTEWIHWAKAQGYRFDRLHDFELERK